MYTGLLHTHRLVVTLFLLLYLVKLVLLLSNKKESLELVRKKTRIPEMIISSLFLITGVVMLFNVGEIDLWLYIKLALVFLSIPIAVRGFKSKNKVLAFFSVLLILTAYGMGEMGKRWVDKQPISSNVVSDPSAANYDQLAHGKAMFEVQCATCHGEDGKAQKSGAKDLSQGERTDEEIRTLIMNGKNAMPGYKDVYSLEEIDALLAYVKEFRK